MTLRIRAFLPSAQPCFVAFATILLAASRQTSLPVMLCALLTAFIRHVVARSRARLIEVPV